MKPTPLQTGAPAVLDVAAKWEAHAREEVDRLEKELAENQSRQLDPANDGDTDLVKRTLILSAHLDGALKRWKMFADMVHKLDRSVEPAKRSAEETITREEGARVFAMFAISMRTACERIKENLAVRMREAATNEEAFELIDATFSEEFRSAMKSAVENQNIPSWGMDAIEAAI